MDDLILALSMMNIDIKLEELEKDPVLMELLDKDLGQAIDYVVEKKEVVK